MWSARIVSAIIFPGLLVGCDVAPPPPNVDAAAEKDDEQRIKSAAAAERKAKGKGTKPVRNPDDE